MEKQFDVAVLIGRFQPFHKGHAGLLAKALETGERVIMVLGSSRQARTARNPFTWEERAAMVTSTLDEAAAARVSVVPVADLYDDRRWAEAVGKAVEAQCPRSGCSIALIGHRKDASSRYLELFPHWRYVPVPRCGEFDAVSIRRIYFEGEDPAATQALLSGLLPSSIAHYLKGWAALPAYGRMREEHLAVEASRKEWGLGPFVTLDAVVTVAGHVLLIRRGNAPGKGLWALPGGFLERDETLLRGAIRELREETGLEVPDGILENSLKGVAVFDHPERSQRGRTITHAHWFDLGEGELPRVAGADDAAEAHWLPVAELAGREEEFFEDHMSILKRFLPV